MQDERLPEPTPSEAGPSELTPKAFALWIALVAAVTAIPLLVTPILPFVDYPNHLARIAILRDLNGSLGTYFQGNARLLPNLGMDALMLALSAAMPVERAGQIAVVLVAVLFVTGFARLHAILHGARTPWAATGALAFYTLPLLFGFLNFVLGVALAMHVLAGWLAIRSGKTRIVYGVLAGFVLLVCHLLGLVFVGLLAPILDRVVGRSWRAALGGLLAFVPAALAYVLLSPRPSGGSKIDPSTLSLKQIQAVTTFVSGHAKTDLLFLALAGLGILAQIVVRRARIRLPLLIPAGLFLILWLALPFGIGGTANLDARFPAVVALFALLAVGVGKASPAATKIAFGLLGGLILYRAGTLAAAYRREGGEIAAVRTELARLPADAVVVPIRDERALVWDAFGWHPPLVYAAHLATLEGHYVAGTFDDPTQQPIQLREGWEAIGAYRATTDVPAELARLRREVAGLARKPGPVWTFVIEPPAAPREPLRWRLAPLLP